MKEFIFKLRTFFLSQIDKNSLFISGVAPVLNNKQTTLEQKIEGLICTYIDKLSQEPELPLFIVNQIKASPEDFIKKLGIEPLIKKSFFLKQIMASDYLKRLQSLNPLHIAINMVGLIVAPFIMAPMIKKIGKIDDQHFLALVQERKALIPYWIFAMIKKGPE